MWQVRPPYAGFVRIIILGSLTTVLSARAEPSSAGALVAAIVEDATKAGFSGAVLVRDASGVVFERAVGSADRNGSIPATLDTVFGVASISKQFTAVAILQLEEAGRLDVKDLMARFLSDVPEDKRGITLHHLLTHTSGLGQNFLADGIVERDQAVRAIFAAPLESAVGERFGYSNDGYTLLAAIVEIASGLDFDRYLRERVFGPAGMTRTGVWADVAERRPPDVAELLRELPANNAKPNWGFRGGTGVHTTVRDLDRYWTAFAQGTVVSASGRERMFTPYSTTRIGPYGYGWFVGSSGTAERRWMTRGNEDFGPNGIVIVHPDRPLLVIVLSHRFVAESTQAKQEDVPWSRRLGEEIEKAMVSADPRR